MRVSSLPARLCEGRGAFPLPPGSIRKTSFVIQKYHLGVQLYSKKCQTYAKFNVSPLLVDSAYYSQKISEATLFSLEVTLKLAIMRRQRAPPKQFCSVKNSVFVSSIASGLLVC